MRDYDLIQVLWVEDDPKVTATYPLKAEQMGLELVCFPCWDDAKATLENDFDRWSAIILDAKCKHHRDSPDSAIVFLREALKDIAKISENKHRIIPWYVLTGGDENEVSDCINDERLEWDSDWKEKKYYSKAVDTEMLFHRIKIHASYSPSFQIHKMYKNVFDAIVECGIDDMAYIALEELLIPIHYPDMTGEKDYNDKFVKARDILEYIFRSMSSKGLLPDWGDKVNLQWSNCILSGMNATVKKADGSEIVVVKSNKQIFTPVIKKIMREMIRVIPPFCHSDSEGDNNSQIKKNEYFSMVNNSTSLLMSFALQLCDVILWYRYYLKGHKDKKHNSLEWEVLNKQKLL